MSNIICAQCGTTILDEEYTHPVNYGCVICTQCYSDNAYNSKPCRDECYGAYQEIKDDKERS